MDLKKRISCLCLFLLLSDFAGAAPQYAFRIAFADKTGSPPLSNPSAFLSQRALARRMQQGISTDLTDQPVSPLYLDTVLTLTQGKLHVTSKWLNTCVVLLTDSSKILLLQNKPYISDISYVAYYGSGLHNKAGNKFDGERVEADRPAFKTTGTPAYYGATWDQTDMVDGDCLHDNGWLGQGKLIAVLDDGFHFVDTAPGFDSLRNSGRIADERNFVLATNDVYTEFLLHGTEVLSTMAAYVPNSYVGAAPLAQYALYVTEDQSGEQPIEMDNMIAGFERADSIGADIISSSLGYNNFNAPHPGIPPSQLDGKTTPAAIAANLASQKGMLLVITAGNEGSGNPPGPGAGLLTPGDADSVLTIGSVNIGKVPAVNSGYGPNAAGVIKPEVCALGNPGYVMTSSLATFPVSGTSIATPQIAGFAACLWQGSPGRTSSQIKAAILKSSDFYNNPQLPQLGYGVPDFCLASGMLGTEETPSGGLSLRVYPNPFTDAVNVRLNASASRSLDIQVTDITGKTILSVTRSVHAGEQNVYVPLPASLAPGVYLCRLVLAEQVRTVRIVKE